MGRVQEWSKPWTRRAYGVTVFTLLFAIPAAFVVSAFVLIVRKLWTEDGQLRGETRSTSGVVRSRRTANVLAGRRRIARLLGAIAVAFAICWTPYHLLRSVTGVRTARCRCVCIKIH